jgi:hypothetical protein
MLMRPPVRRARGEDGSLVIDVLLGLVAASIVGLIMAQAFGFVSLQADRAGAVQQNRSVRFAFDRISVDMRDAMTLSTCAIPKNDTTAYSACTVVTQRVFTLPEATSSKACYYATTAPTNPSAAPQIRCLEAIDNPNRAGWKQVTLKVWDPSAGTTATNPSWSWPNGVPSSTQLVAEVMTATFRYFDTSNTQIVDTSATVNRNSIGAVLVDVTADEISAAEVRSGKTNPSTLSFRIALAGAVKHAESGAVAR